LVRNQRWNQRRIRYRAIELYRNFRSCTGTEHDSMNAREAGIDPSQDVILFSVVTLVQGAVRCTQFLLIALSAGLVCCGCSTSRHTAPAAWPKYTLTNAQSWRVNLPSGERMDASGLCFTSHGELLTVSDRLLEVYRIDAPSDAANAELTPLSDGLRGDVTCTIRHRRDCL
jgi:hypothetical protein